MLEFGQRILLAAVRERGAAALPTAQVHARVGGGAHLRTVMAFRLVAHIRNGASTRCLQQAVDRLAALGCRLSVDLARGRLVCWIGFGNLAWARRGGFREVLRPYGSCLKVAGAGARPRWRPVRSSVPGRVSAVTAALRRGTGSAGGRRPLRVLLDGLDVVRPGDWLGECGCAVGPFASEREAARFVAAAARTRMAEPLGLRVRAEGSWWYVEVREAAELPGGDGAVPGEP